LLRPVEYGQYTSIRFGEALLLEGLGASVGSVGDAYDNALAESTIGLYKNECVRSPNNAYLRLASNERMVLAIFRRSR
jgi:transposase InsO family protein